MKCRCPSNKIVSEKTSKRNTGPWVSHGHIMDPWAARLLFYASLYHSFREGRHPTPVLLPGESHGRRSLVGCSPRGRSKSDMTECLHFHFSLSCIREGNGNTLQCSYLENPRDGGAWWAAVYGVAQSRTRLSDFTFPFHFHA